MLDLDAFKESELTSGFITPEEHRHLVFSVGGSRRQVFAFTYEPGSTEELHSHPQLHLIFVRSGKIEFTVDNTTRFIEAGDFITILPNTLHGFSVVSDDAPHLIEVIIFP
jgi:quercetin dioxygenase-like cupin family protein